MLAAGSRYETPETSGIAHFAEHMFFKGTESRPTARDIGNEIDGIGGEFNAFTGKEYTGYYVRCAGEHRVDRPRRARRHAPPLEVRPRGDRAREGRDRRGDEHVLRHAARLHRRRLRLAPLRRPAARLGHHRDARRRSGPRRATRSSATSTAGTSPSAWSSASAGKIDDDLASELERLLGDVEPAETGDAGSGRGSTNGGPARQDPHEGVGPGAPLPRRSAATRSSTRTATRSRCSRPCSAPGMSSRLFTEVRERRGLAYYVYALNHSYTDAGSLYSQAGVDIERIDEAITTIVARAAQDRRRARAGRRAREGEERREGPLRAPDSRARTG